MKSTKKKFKSTREMLSFLDSIKKRNEKAIKRHDTEIKKYEDLLKKTESVVAEPVKRYKRKSNKPQ